MEYQKVINLLGNTLETVSKKVTKFSAKKWLQVHDQSGNENNRYQPSKQIRFKTSMLQSDFCDYSNACILIKGTITVRTGRNRVIDGYNRNLFLKINALFISLILKINNVKLTMQKI